jgi:signal transduction histidine kinase
MLLEIQDSGPGFDLPSVKVGDRCLTLGLLDMRQRVEMVGGQLAVASSVRSGTTIRATLPMTTPAFFPPPAPLAIA